MKTELKSLKINKRLSEETTCFSATLYVEGIRTAEVGNRGCGGSHEWHILNKEMYAKFQAYVNSLPDKPKYEVEDSHIDDLMDKIEKQKLCKKGLVFRLKSDDKYAYRILSGPADQAGRDYIKKQFGDQVAEILNDSI